MRSHNAGTREKSGVSAFSAGTDVIGISVLTRLVRAFWSGPSARAAATVVPRIDASCSRCPSPSSISTRPAGCETSMVASSVAAPLTTASTMPLCV